MWEHCEQWSMQCEICASHRARPTALPVGILDAEERSRPPWTDIYVDFQGPFPETVRGQKYICTYTCGLLRVPLMVSLPSLEKEEAMQAVSTCMLRSLTLPEKLRHDRGPEMTNAPWQEVVEVLGIKEATAVGHRPMKVSAQAFEKILFSGSRVMQSLPARSQLSEFNRFCFHGSDRSHLGSSGQPGLGCGERLLQPSPRWDMERRARDERLLQPLSRWAVGRKARNQQMHALHGNGRREGKQSRKSREHGRSRSPAERAERPAERPRIRLKSRSPDRVRGRSPPRVRDEEERRGSDAGRRASGRERADPRPERFSQVSNQPAGAKEFAKESRFWRRSGRPGPIQRVEREAHSGKMEELQARWSGGPRDHSRGLSASEGRGVAESIYSEEGRSGGSPKTLSLEEARKGEGRHS